MAAEAQDIVETLNEKSKDLKDMLKDLQANLEQWKFSIEENKDGIRVEIHAAALIKKQKS